MKALYNLLEQLKDLIVVDNLMYTVRDLDVVITELVGTYHNPMDVRVA